MHKIKVEQILEEITPEKEAKLEKLISYYNYYILPVARKKLKLWQQRASNISNPKQALLASRCIKNKARHSIATSIFVSSLKPSYTNFLLDKYIALALMLDYLDDIIDKANEHDLGKIKNMQQAMIEALNPPQKQLLKYPKSEMLNPSYLKKMVATASEKIDTLPNYWRVYPYMVKAMEDFVRTQVDSCMSYEERKILAKKWAEESFARKWGLTWFEHQAVQASPLRAYALLWLSTKSHITEDQIKQINNTYIWFGGINVLGDQFNDLVDDKLKNEVNQIVEYRVMKKAEERFIMMVCEAYNKLNQLPDSSFHLFILSGLINLYMRPLLRTRWNKMANLLCKKFRQIEIL